MDAWYSLAWDNGDRRAYRFGSSRISVAVRPYRAGWELPAGKGRPSISFFVPQKFLRSVEEADGVVASVGFEVGCLCGEKLAVVGETPGQEETKYLHGTPSRIVVQPCRQCLREAREATYEEGREDGVAESFGRAFDKQEEVVVVEGRDEEARGRRLKGWAPLKTLKEEPPRKE